MTMPETTPEMLAMARRHAAAWYRMDAHWASEATAISFERGERDHTCTIAAALAAIKETTERAAKTCEQRGHVTSADALRNGEHYHD